MIDKDNLCSTTITVGGVIVIVVELFFLGFDGFVGDGLVVVADVVEYEDAVIVDIDGVDESVDDIVAELFVVEIADTEGLDPCDDLLLGEANGCGDAELGDIGLQGCALCL